MEEKCTAENNFIYHPKVLLLDEQNAHDFILLFKITQHFRGQALDSQTASYKYVQFWSFVLKEVKWVMVKFLGTKVPRILGWPYIEGTWLYCDNFICYIFCTVVVLTTAWVFWYVYLYLLCFVLFVLCLLFHVRIFIPICFVCTSVQTTVTEWKFNCS
jgi:hypothetical protein